MLHAEDMKFDFRCEIYDIYIYTHTDEFKDFFEQNKYANHEGTRIHI